jgi:tRNA pseudouridine32 synthase / 23S rRNA pseudouridine746 synthase
VQGPPFTVLYLDEHLVAVDKPAGRLTIPGRGSAERAVRHDLEEAFGSIWVVHRLDRGTSGVLLFARSAQAHRALNLAFDRHEVAKRYLALVRGRPPALATLEVPLVPARRGRMRPARPDDPRSKAASTTVRLRAAFEAHPPLPALALVEALPRTGRTHQIRVHLAWAGTPLLFDPDYGEKEPLCDAAGTVLLARTPLHAEHLELRHPISNALLTIEAPWPADMARLVEVARGP